MKISFEGCGPRGRGRYHEHGPKEHDLRPHKVYDPGGESFYGTPGEPATWYSGRFVHGVLNGLSLRGSYEVYLRFEDAELENWLKSYIATKPQEALDLLAKMLPLAVEKLKAED